MYVHLAGEDYDPNRIFTSDLRYGPYVSDIGGYAKVRCKNSIGIIVFTSQMYIQKYPFSIGIPVRISLKVGNNTERGSQPRVYIYIAYI